MQKVKGSGSPGSSMLVLTRWVLDQEICNVPVKGVPPGPGGPTSELSDPIDDTVKPAASRIDSDAEEPGTPRQLDEDLPIGGWLLDGPGIGPTTISLTDPSVPNMELISKVFFTTRIVDTSVTF